MSRTHRRTNAEYLFHGPKQIQEVPAWELKWAGLESAQVYLDQCHADFHRDNRPGRYGVPRAFRNGLNRIDRHAARAEIIRHRQMGCWEGQLPQRQVRYAAWMWW